MEGRQGYNMEARQGYNMKGGQAKGTSADYIEDKANISGIQRRDAPLRRVLFHGKGRNGSK